MFKFATINVDSLNSKSMDVFVKLAFPSLNIKGLSNVFKAKKIHTNTQGTLLDIIARNERLMNLSMSSPESAVIAAQKTLGKSAPGKGVFISVPMGGKVRV